MSPDFESPWKAAFSVENPGFPQILVVDDDFVNRMLLREILVSSGYEVHEASNGYEAFDFAKSLMPELILLDIMMPDIDGYEVCKRLKNDAQVKDIPVIFITALSNPADLVRGFDVGAEDYLSKPINVEEVKARVRTHLKLRAATEKVKRYNEELERVVAESSKELIRAERQAAFGQLIQGIVHNLRGPLTAMRGGIEIGQRILSALTNAVEEGAAPSQKQLSKWSREASQTLELTASASQRLNEMINSLMIKGSADNKRELEELDLNDIVRRELDFLSADLEFKHKIGKEVELWPEKLMVLANASEVAQVLNNLLSNAKDAMYQVSSPQLRIITKCQGVDAIMIVADNGCGISSEALDRLFEPFYTTKGSIGEGDNKKSGLTGTGLGLFMSLRSIRSIGGDIEVESAPGQGTAFKITIPLVAAGK
ncbi:MAG: hybrid sensor histidine kinase/response regulator [Desulfobulbaceae bacterium]|nr:hybrid sensor histidine kinase/response regulator [Desulfobulbaceae bacterium]HIJ78001.1 hybrid sensor histidine kinase/response regulator [Deltaproteobacteria bacterium]